MVQRSRCSKGKKLMTEELYKEMLYRAMSDDGLMARIMSEAPDNSKGDNYDE